MAVSGEQPKPQRLNKNSCDIAEGYLFIVVVAVLLLPVSIHNSSFTAVFRCLTTK